MNEPNDKLIRAKENIARNNAAKDKGTGIYEGPRDRLPPGQRLVKDGWPVLDLGMTPNVPTSDWSLEVGGECGVKTFDWETFNALPQSKLTTDFHCVTTWSIYDAQVEGVLWKNFIDAIEINDGVEHALFHTYDGYTTNVSMRELASPDCAIIHSYAGEPLDKTHGGPARIWVPHLYAWKSAKWIKRIEFCKEEKKGFWELRGYHNHGDPWKEERYS